MKSYVAYIYPVLRLNAQDKISGSAGCESFVALSSCRLVYCEIFQELSIFMMMLNYPRRLETKSVGVRRAHPVIHTLIHSAVEL